MLRLLCYLGIHATYLGKFDTGHAIVSRRCQRCGKVCNEPRMP